jgi:hypothetical protein
VTIHQVHAPEITLLSPTEADGTWAMCGYLRINAPDVGSGHLAYGHYLETYRRGADNEWRISSKRNVRLRLDPFGFV